MSGGLSGFRGMEEEAFIYVYACTVGEMWKERWDGRGGGEIWEEVNAARLAENPTRAVIRALRAFGDWCGPDTTAYTHQDGQQLSKLCVM